MNLVLEEDKKTLMLNSGPLPTDSLLYLSFHSMLQYDTFSSFSYSQAYTRLAFAKQALVAMCSRSSKFIQAENRLHLYRIFTLQSDILRLLRETPVIELKIQGVCNEKQIKDFIQDTLLFEVLLWKQIDGLETWNGKRAAL